MCALYEQEPDNFDAIYHSMQAVRRLHQAPLILSCPTQWNFNKRQDASFVLHCIGSNAAHWHVCLLISAHGCLQMQACGAPPDDIVQELSPGLGLGGLGGMPQVPGIPSCSVM